MWPTCLPGDDVPVIISPCSVATAGSHLISAQRSEARVQARGCNSESHRGRTRDALLAVMAQHSRSLRSVQARIERQRQGVARLLQALGCRQDLPAGQFHKFCLSKMDIIITPFHIQSWQSMQRLDQTELFCTDASCKVSDPAPEGSGRQRSLNTMFFAIAVQNHV